MEGVWLVVPLITGYCYITEEAWKHMKGRVNSRYSPFYGRRPIYKIRVRFK